MTQTLLVVAGEDSGDLHGAELLRELEEVRRGGAGFNAFVVINKCCCK